MHPQPLRVCSVRIEYLQFPDAETVSGDDLAKPGMHTLVRGRQRRRQADSRFGMPEGAAAGERACRVGVEDPPEHVEH